MSKGKKVEKVKSAKPVKSGVSATKIVRAKLSAGVTNPGTILEAIRKEIPKSKATLGYVRHVARHVIGKPLSTKAVKSAKTKSAKTTKPAKVTKPAKAVDASEASGAQAEL